MQQGDVCISTSCKQPLNKKIKKEFCRFYFWFSQLSESRKAHHVTLQKQHKHFWVGENLLEQCKQMCGVSTVGSLLLLTGTRSHHLPKLPSLSTAGPSAGPRASAQDGPSATDTNTIQQKLEGNKRQSFFGNLLSRMNLRRLALVPFVVLKWKHSSQMCCFVLQS